MTEKMVDLILQFTFKISIGGQQVRFYFLEQGFPEFFENATGKSGKIHLRAIWICR
jgi:hypothetical protein